MRYAIPSLLIVALSISGCASNNGSFSSGGGTPTGPGSGSNAMSAQINGVQWTASSIVASYSNGTLSITGSDNLTTLGIGVAATGPGSVTSGTTANLATTNQPGTWQAGPNGGSGTVTITTLITTFNPRSAAGAFSFTLVPTPGSGATGTKTVANGTFNVSF
jgi:Family of unknown function (DUF6252)